MRKKKKATQQDCKNAKNVISSFTFFSVFLGHDDRNEEKATPKRK